MLRHVNVKRLVHGCTAALFIGLLLPPAAQAQDRLGAHFGFVLPIVTRAGGETTTLADRFNIGFPTGITVKTSDKVAFDLELVPTIQRTPYAVGLTVHPGFLYALPKDYTAGLRMAFDVNQASWGFTPLLHRKLLDLNPSCNLFGELVLPIRFQDNNNSIGLGIHVGIGF
jgi:hypothetical protein